MTTRKVRSKHNQTNKMKKGGSIQCIYNTSSKKLNITIGRAMLESDLNTIKPICIEAIEKSRKSNSAEKVKKAPTEKSRKSNSAEKAKKVPTELVAKPASQKKKLFEMFPSSESLTFDPSNLRDGRKDYNRNDSY
jgi:hypothetical protein